MRPCSAAAARCRRWACCCCRPVRGSLLPAVTGVHVLNCPSIIAPATAQVLTESYLTGAALGLPVKLFSSVFLDTRSVRLRNAAGHEWSGKVSVRDDRGQRSGE